MSGRSVPEPLGRRLSPWQRRAWRVVQTLVWVLGLAIWIALLVAPPVGIHAFWNVLIPVAPALLVFAPGLWRNVCPLASTALLARHVGLSRRRRISDATQSALGVIGLGVLLIVVPLRHVVLDTSGPATALTLAVLACVAFATGMLLEWRAPGARACARYIRWRSCTAASPRSRRPTPTAPPASAASAPARTRRRSCTRWPDRRTGHDTWAGRS